MPKKIANKEIWVKQGLEQFSKDGSAGLKIEVMARSIGVSKASFYHFFESREVFLQDIITYWRELRTDELIAFSEEEADNLSKIEKLILVIFSADADDDFLFYLRRLGQKDKAIQAVLLKVESQRVKFACSALEELGFSREIAEEKAKIIYNYYLGWRERQKSSITVGSSARDELALLVRQLNLTPN